MAPLVVPAIRWFEGASETAGIVGAAALIVGVYLVVNMPLNVHLIVKTVETSYRRLLTTILYPIVASTVMGIAVYGTQRSMPLDWPIGEFFVLVLVGVVSYFVAVAVLEFRFGWGLERNVRRIVDVMQGQA
jgi:hypothetical protein